ncbi:MAG: hypothetical protein ACTSVA_06470 [Candidatus Njordarchaeales archaeon]
MVDKIPDLQFPYETSIEGLLNAIIIQKAPNKFDIVFPELRTNGSIYNIVRAVRVIEFDWQQGTFSEVGSYPIPSELGFNIPQLFRYGIGYDLDNDRILLLLGEWDGTHMWPSTTKAKVIAINRSLDSHEVIIDDVFALLQQVVSEAHHVGYCGNCYIINGLGALVCTGYTAPGVECAFHAVSTDGGVTWEPRHSNDRYDYGHQKLEPFWDGDTFMGFLVEGHGTNCLWIKTDGSYEANTPGGAYTIEPVYDMLNNEVIWLEWGSGTGAVQHIWYASPSSPFSANDVTPSGTITDAEGNTIDLATICKLEANIITLNGVGYLLFVAERGGIPFPEERRIICTPLPVRSGNTYELLTYSGGDRIGGRVGQAAAVAEYIRTFDISSKKPLPDPLINIPLFPS